jgi:hypothetical protein
VILVLAAHRPTRPPAHPRRRYRQPLWPCPPPVLLVGPMPTHRPARLSPCSQPPDSSSCSLKCTSSYYSELKCLSNETALFQQSSELMQAKCNVLWKWWLSNASQSHKFQAIKEQVVSWGGSSLPVQPPCWGSEARCCSEGIICSFRYSMGKRVLQQQAWGNHKRLCMWAAQSGSSSRRQCRPCS